MTIIGDVTFGPNALLDLKLGGTVQGTDFDHVAVSGNAAFAGTLKAAAVNGFVPSGQTFAVVTCGGTCRGSFAVRNLPPAYGSNVTAGLLELIPLGPGTIFWDDEAGDDLWFNARNWNSNRLPGASDDVIIGLIDGSGVIFDDVLSGVSGVTVKTLRSEEGFTLSGNDTLRVSGVATFNGDLTVNGGVLNLGADSTVKGLTTLSKGAIDGAGGVCWPRAASSGRTGRS